MSPALQRAVVTGAGGYLGSRLARRLARDGVELVLIARDLERTTRALEAAGGAVVGGCSCDLADAKARYEALQVELFSDADAVFHCAADLSFLGSESQYETNVVASAALYECAADAAVPSFVFVSSVDASGSSPAPAPRGVDEYGFHSPYGLSKLLAEERLLGARRAGTRLAIARLGILIGDDDNFLGALLTLCRDEPGALRALAQQRLPLAPTQDAIEALLALAAPGADGSDGSDGSGARHHVFESNPTIDEFLRTRGLRDPLAGGDEDLEGARERLRAHVRACRERGEADLTSYLAWPSLELAGRTLRA